MAKKNKERKQSSAKKGVSKPESFTHGMVSDLDPHFQLQGSYSDAKNIRLTNSEGDTFTVENIEGNSLFVDLATYHIDTLPDQYQTNASYPTFYDRGPEDDIALLTNQELSNRCSIVGHVSYANQMLLIIVGRFEYNRGGGTPFVEEKDRTIFLMVDFDHEMKVTQVTDMRVCYGASGNQYPDLNMDLDVPVRVEHIVENDKISRIYWTDNKNSLRTLNIKQDRLDLLETTSLDITPLMNPAQPILSTTIFGSLPVGVYQYTYKYIDENGGESNFSPLSNMYHTSDQSFGNSTLYAGGPKGNLGTQGFQINIEDVDQNFTHVELYSLFYDSQNSPPRVSIVARNQVDGALVSFQHTSWNNEVENGLEEILIESNTFDVCKDIAIKDNILFAANLRQKRNFISEKEWNVKVLRYRRVAGNSSILDAMLTTNDPTIKHYQANASGDPVEINSAQYEYGVLDEHGFRCGYGELLGDPNGMYPATSNEDHFNYDGTINTPMWTTAIENQRGAASGGHAKYQTLFLYKYLSDRMTLGAESFNYASNGLGGCRVSFGLEEKIADTSQNAFTSPYISSVSTGETLQTDYSTVFGTAPSPSGNTVFKTSMSLGGSKDPHLAGDRRGYQRGEVYRFGVQVYDLNGSPGNVLWIGDIETPHQHDLNRMINIKDDANVGSGGYTPFRPTPSGTVSPDGAISLVDAKQIVSHEKIGDFRLSFVYGHTVPPVDVEWFSGRISTSYKDLSAYVKSDGNPRGTLPNDGTQDNAYSGKVKAVPAMDGDTGGAGADGLHDDIHYLFDLCVNFEFLIPDEVCKKISGFRVVRAQRNEEDRRIIQQGLLNQTAQYGNAKLGPKYGYSVSRFSQKDNEAFGDDPVFVNQYIDNGGANSGPNPTFTEQPEYNVYLNGYLGLAETSHMAFYDSSVTDGKVTAGGNTDGTVFYWPEREDAKYYNSGGARHARFTGLNTSAGGPGTYGNHFRHSGYFGSYDKLSQFRASHLDSNVLNESNLAQVHQHISGTVFTLDSPDSAFGIRPYISREGDILRIDDILKLTDEVRYENRPGGSNNPFSFYSHCQHKTQSDLTTSEQTTHHWNYNSGNENWKPTSTDQTMEKSLAFCTRKNIDKDYSILIGKYYSYEPYMGMGWELEGGKVFCNNPQGDSNTRPNRNYGWSLPISNAKEISDGEIVPNGFFKISRKVKESLVSGFSNNTLGFVNQHANIPDGQSTYVNNSYNSLITRNFAFGAVRKDLPANKGMLASDGQQTTIKEEDYNYDTVSTLQMGLRSILIEIDNRCSVVKKSGPDTSFFEALGESATRPQRHYSAWFAPFNISALCEQGEFLGVDNSNNSGGNVAGGYNSAGEYPLRSGWLNANAQRGIANTNIGDENPGNGIKQTLPAGGDKVPFKFLCSIVRKVVPYGGYNKGAIDKTRYIPCGNFHRVGDSTNVTQGHVSQVFGGDTFVNLYSHQKTSAPYMKKSAARWQIFPVESYVNTDMRSGLTLNAGDTVVGKDMNQAPYSNDWLYNSIYSQENNIKSGLLVDEETFEDSLNLPYEIAYSNTKILGQKSDAFRQFPINQFHDMEGLYGEINRIINFKNEIYVLQDSAFSKLLVNPMSMLSDDAGTSLFTGTGETVENHIYISTKYGSRHRFSVAMSEKSLYFVDSNFGRLFKYDTEKLISLGDALGQRNYLKYIIKEWEQRSFRACTVSGHTTHPNFQGMLDSIEKPTDSRNYLSDNPLNFLGITSIYDFKNKELLVTFHNSAWASKDKKRQVFARPWDNHTMGNALDGEPVGISETLVYSEAINAFTSKYSVAPPQWLAGGQGSFILSPENEINVNSISNFDQDDGLSGTWTNVPYYAYGSNDSYFFKNRRCNPLRLWIWDKHEEQIKTNFFGKKDDIYERLSSFTSPITGAVETTSSNVEIHPIVPTHAGNKYVAEESYVEKIINSEAANSKIFDNVQNVMTPKHVEYSFIDYTTDITHDTIKTKNTIDNKTELIDETEQLVINRRWDFNETHDGWKFYEDYVDDYSMSATPVINTGLNTPVTSINYIGGAMFDGKYFFFDESTMNTMLGNSDWNNTVVNLIQERTGVVVWSGECKLWDSTSVNSTPTAGTGNSHGRRNSGAAAGQWQVGDLLKTSLTGSSVTLEYTGAGWFLSPEKGEHLSIPGKYNNIIRMRLKRLVAGVGWDGRIQWKGYDPIRRKQGDYLFLNNNNARSRVIAEPGSEIDDGFIIIEWDMSGAGDANGRWDDCIIEQIWVRLSKDDSSKFEVDWIEIGGLKAHKYIDGVLRTPLRTEKSTHRTRGTYAKIKYTAKTTEKFNIFAILAKYRKTY